MSEWKIRFGTAGTSDSFTAMGYKNSLDIPAYTEKMGLDAFEYQCGHGVRLGLRHLLGHGIVRKLTKTSPRSVKAICFRPGTQRQRWLGREDPWRIPTSSRLVWWRSVGMMISPW